MGTVVSAVPCARKNGADDDDAYVIGVASAATSRAFPFSAIVANLWRASFRADEDVNPNLLHDLGRVERRGRAPGSGDERWDVIVLELLDHGRPPLREQERKGEVREMEALEDRAGALVRGRGALADLRQRGLGLVARRRNRARRDQRDEAEPGGAAERQTSAFGPTRARAPGIRAHHRCEVAPWPTLRDDLACARAAFRPRATPFRARRAALAALAEPALPFLDLLAHLRELLAQRIQLATAFSVALAKRSVLFLELRCCSGVT